MEKVKHKNLSDQKILNMKKEAIIFVLSIFVLLLSANILLRAKIGGSNAEEGDVLIKNTSPKTEISDSKNAQNQYDFAFSKEQKKGIILYAYSAIDDHLGAGSSGPADFGNIGFQYDKVFVTFINGGKVRCCQSGTADPGLKNRLEEDLKTAVVKCANDERFGAKLTKEELPDLSMTVDFLYNEKPVSGHSVSELGKGLEIGLNAIKIRLGGKSAFFKASVPIEKNFSLQTTLSRLCVKAKLADDCYSDEKTEVFKYDSINFKGDRSGNVAELYRSNVLIDEQNIDKDRVMQSINLGYEWFVKNIDSETKMPEYMYHPSTDAYESSVNHIRILASTWALTEIMKFLNTDSMKGPVGATLDNYFKKYEASDSKGIYLNIDGQPNIANNAFALMALINYKDYPNRNELMKGLASRLLAEQQADGRLLTDFEAGGESGIDFYPGESLLALTKYYYETGDIRYYDAVAKAFPYYSDYWRSHKNTAFVPWQTQTYYLMYQKNNNPEWADFVFEMNDWLVDNYQQLQSDYPDYLGGFKKVPGNSSSAYAEGISDAYSLAKMVKDENHEKKFLKSARLVARFVMQGQLTNENAFYYKNAERAVGGFRMSLLDNRIRCDNNQHAILSLMKVFRYDIY